LKKTSRHKTTNSNLKQTTKYKTGYQAASKYTNGSKKQKFAEATKLNGTHQNIPPTIWLRE